MTANIKILLSLLLVSRINCHFLQFCYFPSMTATFTNPDLRVFLEDIDATPCTHIIYTPIVVDKDSNPISIYDMWTSPDQGESRFRKFTKFATTYPGMTSLVEFKVTSDFLAQSLEASSRDVLCQTIINFVKDYNFQGLQLDWTDPDPSSDQKPKESFMEVMKKLREIIDAEKKAYTLTLTMSHDPKIIQNSYDFKILEPLVDYFILNAFHYAGTESKVIIYNNALFPGEDSESTQCISWTVNAYIKGGMPLSKIIVGFRFLYIIHHLSDPKHFEPGAPAFFEFDLGMLYEIPYQMTPAEICLKLNESGTQQFYDDKQVISYLVAGQTFVSYDNARSLYKKVHWVKSRELGGIAIYAFGFEDKDGKYCKDGDAPSFKVVSEALARYVERKSNAKALDTSLTFIFLCFWISFIPIMF